MAPKMCDETATDFVLAGRSQGGLRKYRRSLCIVCLLNWAISALVRG
ncbi:hypothetical protein FOPG_19981 [Fusarium oxysporum f. sp. conglutinans race 2 54008]|uniref:Uncharacterized protein n=1 Tax=Fusarium oxysporum f. sp. conglutinans race 2 54008 TaxID=1089457 RepID=X0GV78_FUSOX|nr:hypothetical protein FOPG_19981 [Fusarium oxysporum f. sp. conglutinans race 2 54008]